MDNPSVHTVSFLYHYNIAYINVKPKCYEMT